ncbi:hypothetical protein [Antrihabitans sp. YC2-6]|uniref:hypothetical protein n=1 Tax=Antrihabitans sp. YC2-6 TaxID=2799498 RepID=UPI0018F5E169|nr:hypothetical protein [Antrihabitans sp. YC2-6]MBJ8347596.1 hypothetical protein [Antrihabitans sp. YC2-6]
MQRLSPIVKDAHDDVSAALRSARQAGGEVRIAAARYALQRLDRALELCRIDRERHSTDRQQQAGSWGRLDRRAGCSRGE